VSTLDLAAPRAESAPPALAPPPGHQRFPHVDALRAIAALAIVAVHISALSRVTYNSAVGAYTARLNVGVPIFFCISGFLLYRPFVAAAREGRPPIRLRDYARRRTLRIVPAYWVALTLLAIWPGLAGLFGAHTWVYYGFLQAYSANYVLGGIAPAWTLCIEVTFYLLLPFYALGLRRLTAGRDGSAAMRIELTALAALSAATLVYRTLLFNHPGPQIAASTLPGTFDWFAVGMALAVVSVAAHGREDAWALFRWVRRWPWLPWLLAAVAFWAVSTRIGSPRTYNPDQYSDGAWFGEHVLYALIALLMVVPAVLGSGERGPRRVLSTPLLAWIGLVSYGLYLYHLTLLSQLRDWGLDGWLGLALAGVPLAVAAAAASYYVVERPFLRLKDGRRR
jgi:peptidoglycan/LPS O-acetylase OafA/YrhL